jgi:hypothetical protein
VFAFGYDFPTVLDAKLWLGCAIVCGSILIVFFLAGLLIADLASRFSREDVIVLNHALIVFPLAFAIYVVARLILLAEMFRCLLNAPPEAFVSTTWISWIPHIG